MTSQKQDEFTFPEQITVPGAANSRANTITQAPLPAGATTNTPTEAVNALLDESAKGDFIHGPHVHGRHHHHHHGHTHDHEHEHEHEQPAEPVSPSYSKNMYSSDTTLIPEGDRKEDLRG